MDKVPPKKDEPNKVKGKAKEKDQQMNKDDSVDTEKSAEDLGDKQDGWDFDEAFRKASPNFDE